MRSNPEYEGVIIGFLANSSEGERVEVLASLGEEDFTNSKYRRVYHYLKQNPEVPLNILVADLDGITASELIELYQSMSLPGVLNLVAKLKEVTSIRRVQMLTNELVSNIRKNETATELLSIITKATSDISKSINVENGSLNFVYENLKKQRQEGDIIQTGHTQLDSRTGGMRPGQVWVIGGKSGGGKSMFITDFVAKQIVRGRGCLFFSTEIIAEHELEALAKPFGTYIGLRPEDAEKELVMMDNIKIYSKVRTVDTILLEVKRQMLNMKVDMFVIDHLQDLEYSDKMERHRAVADTMDKIKSFCLETGVRAVLASQLSRSGLMSKDTLQFSFAESSKIEQKCDIAFILVREIGQNGDMTDNSALILQKNRYNGTLGSILMQGSYINKTFEEVKTLGLGI